MVLPSDDIQTVIETINTIRKEHNIPLWQMALDAGISQSTLSQALNGRIRIPEPGYVEQKLKTYLKALKLKYPKRAYQRQN